jgi:hypothetical protein
MQKTFIKGVFRIRVSPLLHSRKKHIIIREKMTVFKGLSITYFLLKNSTVPNHPH